MDAAELYLNMGTRQLFDFRVKWPSLAIKDCEITIDISVNDCLIMKPLSHLLIF